MAAMQNLPGAIEVDSEYQAAYLTARPTLPNCGTSTANATALVGAGRGRDEGLPGAIEVRSGE
ncbi:hypothetical protein GCM10007160_33630 [Litchfieldella qijiaojingensis]|uniref:Uncharacterized protein n=1 Tax=Litchfieldella qijiaojingensis TaxID=980347 RepID=A0ABQ2Z2M6_9GAMM|nr:hypothetical protein GCM10007160_33630 [Halomonas qijiaojingensis]